MMQIGDLDRLRNERIGNETSQFEDVGGVEGCNLLNYFLASGRNTPLLTRSHRPLLELWAADWCYVGLHIFYLHSAEETASTL